jgi:hypothetical protein
MGGRRSRRGYLGLVLDGDCVVLIGDGAVCVVGGVVCISGAVTVVVVMRSLSRSSGRLSISDEGVDEE